MDYLMSAKSWEPVVLYLYFWLPTKYEIQFDLWEDR